LGTYSAGGDRPSRLLAGRQTGIGLALSSSAPKKAAAAEQEEQYEDQDDQLGVVHDRSPFEN